MGHLVADERYAEIIDLISTQPTGNPQRSPTFQDFVVLQLEPMSAQAEFIKGHVKFPSALGEYNKVVQDRLCQDYCGAGAQDPIPPLSVRLPHLAFPDCFPHLTGLLIPTLPSSGSAKFHGLPDCIPRFNTIAETSLMRSRRLLASSRLLFASLRKLSSATFAQSVQSGHLTMHLPVNPSRNRATLLLRLLLYLLRHTPPLKSSLLPAWLNPPSLVMMRLLMELRFIFEPGTVYRLPHNLTDLEGYDIYFLTGQVEAL